MSTLYLNGYKPLAILFFCFVAVYSANASQLAQTTSNLNTPNVLDNGVWVLTNPEAPFVVADDKRQLSGYLVDVVNGILAKADIKQGILAAPWERVEKEARTKSNVVVFALDGEKDQFKSLKELESLGSIAVLDKDVRHRILLAAGYPAIHTFPSWQEAIDAVNIGKSDAIFFSDPGIKHFCFVEGKDCNRLGRVFMYRKIFSYLTLSKVGTDESLVNKIKQAASSFKASEQYQQIMHFWVEKYKNQPIPMHIE
ncbi:transporter substrate-binding domain-containing protein [Aliiglaciecola sp.]|nr:transporter substrate-binding domain-containing protein [Aliiglaciecola sp.]